MRDILFRGKRKDNGAWVYGDLITNSDGKRCAINPHWKYIGRIEILPETVGQYTGLTDKYGKKIFEGDIINHPCLDRLNRPNVVEWDNEWGAFGPLWDARPIEAFPILSESENVEVIGNIHDNPEQTGE